MSHTLARLAEDPTLWSALSPEERLAAGEHLRDRFFALSTLGSAAEERLLRAALQNIDSAPITAIQGLPIAAHPTARFRAVHFLEAIHLDAGVLPLFARPVAQMPELVAVFVDPLELSYRTFDNIVPLDRLHAQLSLALRDRVQRGEQLWTFSLLAPEPTLRALLELDALDLYVPPLYPGGRGGQRYIFHSAGLSEAFTSALREALPPELLEGFSHVNPVFRCNRFEPGDEPFHSHVDNPYSDESRHHVSRYTLLIYLTGGTGSPALRIEDTVLHHLPPLTAVLFHQQSAHEGSPYTDNRKVFLRTELIYEEDSLEYEPGIAELFSKACYLSSDSLFAPELARHAHDYYNRAALAHWRGLQASADLEPFVHKEFRDVHFITNGYDFWFPRGVISLEECAVLTLLDYFNCTIDWGTFREHCMSEVVSGSPTDLSFIPRLLDPFRAPLPEPLFVGLHRALLFPEVEAPDTDRMDCPNCEERDYRRPKLPFDPFRNESILEDYNQARFVAEDKLSLAPMVLMGQEIYLDRTRFLVRSNQIHVLSETVLAPLHFASHLCWTNYGPATEDFLEVEATLQAMRWLVPPILFSETEDCIHLMFDFFRNGWKVSSEVETVHVPRISPKPGSGWRIRNLLTP